MCPRGPSTTSCGSYPRCRPTCPCACWGTIATWASTASSCPMTCATSSTTWTGVPTLPPHTPAPWMYLCPPQDTPVTPGCACNIPSQDAPVPPPHACPPGHSCCTTPARTLAAPPAAGPPGARLGRVRTKQPQGAAGMSPLPWGAWVGQAVRSWGAGGCSGLVWASTRGHPAEQSRLNLASQMVGPSPASRPAPRGTAPRRLGLAASSAQRACRSCLSLSCLCLL